MSELIQKNDNHTAIRWKLLTGASALVLTAYVSMPDGARAEDSHPQLWLELGGDASIVNGQGQPFDLPFMHKEANPGVFDPVSPLEVQKPPRISFDGEAKLSLQPKGSDWIFSAGVRYGRSSSNKHVHQQSRGIPVPSSSYLYQFMLNVNNVKLPYATGIFAYAEFRAHHQESHMVLDFNAGKDVGLGLFGHDSTSTISAGVRVAHFNTDQSVMMRARPDLAISSFGGVIKYGKDFHHYYLTGNAQRSFHGLGPSISWSSSVPLVGNSTDGEFALDWSINGAVLFGKQTVKAHHHTTGVHHVQGHAAYPGGKYYLGAYQSAYDRSANPVRSRSVVVPNIGAFAGLSMKYPNAKVSFGYKADFFFGAMDGGVDVRQSQNMSFHGPFASVSIGLP